MEKEYRYDIDLLKGLSILAVVVYHAGLLDTGYLGVDAFFVINGFLIIPSLLSKEITWSGYYIWLSRRIVRLLPLLLLASLTSLIVGYIGMLPDDYENLSQSVIATNLFANNVLQAITTKNYWDVVNEYKPLMHTWYLGVLMQFYILYPLIVMLVNRCIGSNRVRQRDTNVRVLLFLSFSSLLLYILPNVSDGDRFYMIPYRFFEIGIGGIAGCFLFKFGKISSIRFISFLLSIFLLILLSGWYLSNNIIEYNAVSGTVKDCSLLIPKQILLILMVLITALILNGNQDNKAYLSFLKIMKPLRIIGMMSFSIYIWHQIIMAFVRCYFGRIDNLGLFLLILFFSLLFSLITYKYVEKNVKYSSRFLFLLWGLIMIFAFTIYQNAGVVRDVPEMNITKENAKRGMFAVYCDRVYMYDRNFPEPNGKYNVLVEGYSFGRDFANVLLESKCANKINLSYISLFEDKYVERYKEADFIFAVCTPKDIPSSVKNSIKDKCRIYGLGPKNFGTNNSIIYINRCSEDYFKSMVDIDQGYKILNKQWKKEWHGNYIDFLSIVENGEGKVRVFTDENKYISQDCRHLTPEGAKYFARKINWDEIFEFLE